MRKVNRGRCCSRGNTVNNGPGWSRDEVSRDHSRGERTRIGALACNTHVAWHREIADGGEEECRVSSEETFCGDALRKGQGQIESVCTQQVQQKNGIGGPSVRDVDLRLWGNEWQD